MVDKTVAVAAVSISECSESPWDSSRRGDMKISAEVNERVLKLSTSSFGEGKASLFFDP